MGAARPGQKGEAEWCSRGQRPGEQAAAEKPRRQEGGRRRTQVSRACKPTACDLLPKVVIITLNIKAATTKP